MKVEIYKPYRSDYSPLLYNDVKYVSYGSGGTIEFITKDSKSIVTSLPYLVIEDVS